MTLKIDIVSDVMCPWCIIGYNNLQGALQQLNQVDETELHWHAFELNPDMPKAGQPLQEHIMEKYGISQAESEANRERIIEMGKAGGFKFNFSDDARMINSFDCHRLLTWAAEEGKQTALKLALFSAHFTDNQALNDDTVLADVCASVGLDSQRATDILAGDDYADAVRQEQAKMHQLGISAVPAFIINDKYLISGGQPVAAFVQALQQIQSESAA